VGKDGSKLKSFVEEKTDSTFDGERDHYRHLKKIPFNPGRKGGNQYDSRRRKGLRKNEKHERNGRKKKSSHSTKKKILRLILEGK